jgi:hypothetical protein
MENRKDVQSHRRSMSVARYDVPEVFGLPQSPDDGSIL